MNHFKIGSSPLWFSKLKFTFSEKATKIDKIFTVNLTVCSNRQIDGEDFVNFCGLLRKHELYNLILNIISVLGQRGLMAKIERIYSSIPYTVDELNEKFLECISQDDQVKGPVLQRVHKLLSKNKFRQSLYLLIPEWECQARLLFTCVNTCPSRSLTAEADALYTTFDEILSKVKCFFFYT